MKLKFAKAAAVITLAAAATFVPLAAQAQTYPAADAAQVNDTTVTAGSAVVFTVAGNTFGPGTTINITLSGVNASGGSLGVVKAAATEVATLGQREATADGALSAVRVILPSNATGSYVIGAQGVNALGQAVAVSSPAIVVVAAGGSTGGGLPATGMDSGSLLGLWVGGGALVLAGGAVVVGAAVHRQRKQAA